MKKRNVDVTIRNVSFSAFVCVTLGFVLLETSAFRLGGKPAAHAVGVLIGVTVSALIWRCIAPYWTAVRKQAARPAGDVRLSRIVDVVSALLLAGIGYVGADALLSGWAIPVWAFALCLYLCPWSLIPLCRRSLLIPCGMIAVGAAAHLYTAARLPHPIFLLIAIWGLWTTAACCWLRLVILRQRKSKATTSPLEESAGHPQGVLEN